MIVHVTNLEERYKELASICNMVEWELARNGCRCGPNQNPADCPKNADGKCPYRRANTVLKLAFERRQKIGILSPAYLSKTEEDLIHEA